MADRYRDRFDDLGRKLGFRGLEIHEIPESRARDAANPGSPRKPRQFRPRSPRNPSWWRSTSAATMSTAALLHGILAAGGMIKPPALFTRSAARTDFRPIYGARQVEIGFRLGDLAASNGPRHAPGTDLSGRDYFGRSSLSPRVSRSRQTHRKHRFRIRCSRRGTSISTQMPPATAAGGLRSVFRFQSLCCPRALPASSSRPRQPRFPQVAATPPQTATLLPRGHQATRAGTRSRPRAAEKCCGTAAETPVRYRSDRPGPQQAQCATDRHRRTGAQCRDPDRRRRSAAAPAR